MALKLPSLTARETKKRLAWLRDRSYRLALLAHWGGTMPCAPFSKYTDISDCKRKNFGRSRQDVAGNVAVTPPLCRRSITNVRDGTGPRSCLNPKPQSIQSRNRAAWKRPLNSSPRSVAARRRYASGRLEGGIAAGLGEPGLQGLDGGADTAAVKVVAQLERGEHGAGQAEEEPGHGDAGGQVAPRGAIRRALCARGRSGRQRGEERACLGLGVGLACPGSGPSP